MLRAESSRSQTSIQVMWPWPPLKPFTSEVPREVWVTETKNNAKLTKRIVKKKKKKKIGKTNLLELFSVSADNLSKVDKKKI